MGGRDKLTNDRGGGFRPASPRAVLNIGVTGHRAVRLPPGAATSVPTAIEHALRALAAAATPAIPVLHTPLATGADQFAAIAARSLGQRVHALLPFAAPAYAAAFAEGAEREGFTALLAAADAVTALPGRPSDPVHAYVAVGRAIIATSDVMIAVWDGNREIVSGGTAHVVALALAARCPVVHIRVGDRTIEPAMLLLRGPADGEITRPLATAADYARLIDDLPPQRVTPTIAFRS